MKEVEAIRKLTDEAVAALNRGDVEACLALQAVDAQVLAPLRPAEVGSAAIRAALESLFNEYSVRESRTLEEVEVHGSWAFTRGSYLSVLIPKDGQDAAGAWKYYRSIWNSDRQPINQ